MSRRPSIWHVDESHKHVLDTVKKSKASRWFVDTTDSIAPPVELEGSSNSSNYSSNPVDALADSPSANSERHPASNSALAPSSASSNSSDRSEKVKAMNPPMNLPLAGLSPALKRSSKDEGRSPSLERSRLMQMISDFNVHRAGRLGEIEVRENPDGTITYDGVLRVYWGVKKPIFISNEKVEDLSPQRRRRSKNILATDLQKIGGGKRTWSQSANARRRVRSATTLPLEEDAAVALEAPGARSNSLPNTNSVLLSSSSPEGGRSPSTRPVVQRRATVGEISTAKEKVEKLRLHSTPEDEAEVDLARHHTVSSSPLSNLPPVGDRSREQTIPEEDAEERRPASRSDFRRASEPVMAEGDVELKQQARKAKLQRSISTQDPRWTGIVERVNRRARRNSHHPNANAPKLNVEYFIPPYGSMSNLRTDSSKSTVEVGSRQACYSCHWFYICRGMDGPA